MLLRTSKLIQLFVTVFLDFVSLIFPKTCFACGKSLYHGEECICTYCHYQLPKTGNHLYPDNPIAKLFWGRVPVHSAASYYNFSKEGKVQHLIHQMKYKGHKEIGVSIGKFFGTELKRTELFNSVNTIVPVPLHPAKLRKRGYNQSDFFAEGLSKSMNAEADTKSLVRIFHSDSQTRKNRYARWKNVETVFEIADKKKLEGRHVLLVDDVVTTGATLEACARKILEVPGTKVSIATMSSTRY